MFDLMRHIRSLQQKRIEELIRGFQLVSQLIRVQLVSLDRGLQKGVINKTYNLYHHALG